MYLSWIKKISYVAYGYSGLVKNEFMGARIFTAQGMEVRLLRNMDMQGLMDLELR